jgi:hypothetical protein
MMDKHQQLVKNMLELLKYDSEYSDLQGYAPSLQQVLFDLKSAQDLLKIVESTNKIKVQGLENELRETKKSYLSTIEKLKSYKKRNQEQKLRLEQIKVLANGGVLKLEEN